MKANKVLFFVLVVSSFLLVGCQSIELSSFAENDSKDELVNVNEDLIDEEVSFDSFPSSFKTELSTGRYKVSFSSSSEIMFVMYSEDHYNSWKENGVHTLSKVTTNSRSGCCSTSGEYTVDVNKGESGTYYFVFDASMVEDNPENGSLKVTKVTELK